MFLNCQVWHGFGTKKSYRSGMPLTCIVCGHDTVQLSKACRLYECSPPRYHERMFGIASIGIVEPYYAWLPSTADINNLAPIQKMVPGRGHLGYVCKVPHVFTGTIRERRYVVSRFVPRGVSGCIVTGTAPGTQGLDVTRSRSRCVSAPVPSPGPSQLPVRFRDPWVSECRVRVLRYRTPSRRVGRPRARGPVGFRGAKNSPTKFRPLKTLRLHSGDMEGMPKQTASAPR